MSIPRYILSPPDARAPWPTGRRLRVRRSRATACRRPPFVARQPAHGALSLPSAPRPLVKPFSATACRRLQCELRYSIQPRSRK